MSINANIIGNVVQRRGIIPPSILFDGNTVEWHDYKKRITKDGSNRVSAWGDLSGLNHNLLQSDPDKQPIIDDYGIIFDSIDDYLRTLDYTLNQPEEIWIVFKQLSWISSRYIFDGKNSVSGALIQYGLTVEPELTAATAGTLSPPNGNLPVNHYGIVRILFNGANSEFQINDTPKFTGDLGAFNMGGFTLGARGNLSSPSHIKVKGCIIRKIADSESDKASIYNYLQKLYPIKNIGILGDSISSSIVDDWIQYLDDEIYNINAHAVSGDSIKSDLADQVLTAANDDNDIIIIALGVNDDNNTAIADNLQGIIETAIDDLRISNPNATIYYMNILPVWTDVTGVTPRDKSNIRSEIELACTSRDVECWDTFNDPWIEASDTEDGLHPNASGSLKIWNNVETRIN